MQENGKTQAERFGEALLALKPDVTASDREAAYKETGYTKPTVTKYLQGKGKDLDVAVALLEFFKKRIADREKVLV